MSSLPLSSAELVQMRDELNLSLPGTAVLHSKTATADGQGGQAWTYAAAGTVDARLSPATSRSGAPNPETVLAARLGIVDPYVLTLPSETSVDETYRAVFNSVTYEVRAVMPRVPWEISRRCLVAEVA